MDVFEMEEHARVEAKSIILTSLYMAMYGFLTMPYPHASIIIYHKGCTQYAVFPEQYDILRSQMDVLQQSFLVMIGCLFILSWSIFFMGAFDSTIMMFLLRGLQLIHVIYQTGKIGFFFCNHPEVLNMMLVETRSLAKCLPENAREDIRYLVQNLYLLILLFISQWFIMTGLFSVIPDQEEDEDDDDEETETPEEFQKTVIWRCTLIVVMIITSLTSFAQFLDSLPKIKENEAKLVGINSRLVSDFEKMRGAICVSHVFPLIASIKALLYAMKSDMTSRDDAFKIARIIICSNFTILVVFLFEVYTFRSMNVGDFMAIVHNLTGDWIHRLFGVSLTAFIFIFQCGTLMKISEFFQLAERFYD
uniref:G protein-coupled receptor n=1 Tax=Caenorhabditis tropicalis TaxID=1561998 RepID=A0A1I7TWH1_9PELO